MRILIYNWWDLAHPNGGGAEVYTDRVATEKKRMGKWCRPFHSYLI